MNNFLLFVISAPQPMMYGQYPQPGGPMYNQPPAYPPPQPNYPPPQGSYPPPTY